MLHPPLMGRSESAPQSGRQGPDKEVMRLVSHRVWTNTMQRQVRILGPGLAKRAKEVLRTLVPLSRVRIKRKRYRRYRIKTQSQTLNQERYLLS